MHIKKGHQINPAGKANTTIQDCLFAHSNAALVLLFGTDDKVTKSNACVYADLF